MSSCDRRGVSARLKPSLGERSRPSPARGAFRLLALALVCVPVLAAPTAEPGLTQLTKDGRRKEDLAWSPDGKRLAFSYYHRRERIGIAVMDADGSNLRVLSGQDVRVDRSPTWSADSKRLAFVHITHSGTDGELDLWQMTDEGKDRTRLVEISGKSFDNFPRWSPDGTRLLYTTTKDKTQELYVADADGKNSRRLTSDPSIKQQPSWSPDGKQILFAGNQEGSFDIWSISPDGSGLKRLTADPTLETCPVWRPGGREIAYVSLRDGNPEIFLMNADGSSPRNLSNHPGYDFSPAWTPDGKALSWVSDRAGRYDIFLRGF